mgnify:FL=1
MVGEGRLVAAAGAMVIASSKMTLLAASHVRARILYPYSSYKVPSVSCQLNCPQPRVVVEES